MKDIEFSIFESGFEKADLSKAELARILKVKPNALQGWFDRRSVPSRYLYPIAEALKVNPRYLLGETDDDTRMQIIPIFGNASAVATCMSRVVPATAKKTIERYYFDGCVYGVYADTDSMKGVIGKGSLCLCSPDVDIEINDIVHYSYGDANGIARYRLSVDMKTVVLAPENNEYDPIFIPYNSEIKLTMVKIIRIEQDL